MNLLPTDYVEIVMRLLAAALFSGLIGIEREAKSQPAGLRTHLLVGIGSCLMMILSITGFDSFINRDNSTIRFDPSRIPSYVISGIGFLGAGTIIVHRGSVKGLTTAASVWVAAGLGLTVGAGMYFSAFLTTVIVLLTLYVLYHIESKFFKNRLKKSVLVTAEDREALFSDLTAVFAELQMNIAEFQIENAISYSEKNFSTYNFIVGEGKVDNEIKLVQKLYEVEGVSKVII
ncbi:MgtC/SapB family protein [Planococcus sp. CPCC 101016]|uniref:MgtC/SapB family protein n=1 Tax=Planococcus sp. CPCC 101016 TaxID=2599617 RepID=UPI0011B76788|nr:MgtC/SapB family protein [Planococcus sp. CPCC 101016]TWT06696.1 MgtC/SapB family protein [Planococcus sp. CPCC 101016]